MPLLPPGDDVAVTPPPPLDVAVVLAPAAAPAPDAAPAAGVVVAAVRLVPLPLLDSCVGGGIRRDETGLPRVCMPVGAARNTLRKQII